MKPIVLNVAAICDKAGRPENQDNFWVCPDLSAFGEQQGEILYDPAADEGVVLSEKGMLLMVADGMGGMQAGEVASQIAVDALKKRFAQVPTEILKEPSAIKKWIAEAIVMADEEMKRYAKAHPETEGMGSTIVLLWLVGQRVYAGWCGDSRAYCYNPANRLVRLSYDHSYVQEQVDHHGLSEEAAFYHPYSNVITRSLGDSGERAKPELADYPLHEGDVFLLCSDGLCGLLRDEEIETLLRGAGSVKEGLRALWKAGEEAEWTDNATIVLARVVEGGEQPSERAMGYGGEVEPKVSVTPMATSDPEQSIASEKGRARKWQMWFVVLGVLLLGVAVGFWIGNREEKKPKAISMEQLRDTSARVARDTVQPTETPRASAETATQKEGTSVKTSAERRPKQVDKLNPGKEETTKRDTIQQDTSRRSRLTPVREKTADSSRVESARETKVS